MRESASETASDPVDIVKLSTTATRPNACLAAEVRQGRAGPIGGDEVALAVIESHRVLEGRGGVAGAACAAEHRGELDERVAALADVVGAFGESHRFAGGGLGGLEVAARRQDVGASGELWNLRGGVVGRGPRRGEVGVADRLLVPPLLSEDGGQESGGGRPYYQRPSPGSARGLRGPLCRRARDLRRAARTAIAPTRCSLTTTPWRGSRRARRQAPPRDARAALAK